MSKTVFFTDNQGRPVRGNAKAGAPPIKKEHKKKKVYEKFQC